MTHPPYAIEILLLEDEVADAYLVKIAFKNNKILAKLHHVFNGREGLGFLQQQGDFCNAPRPDLILLDLNMPQMNGYEFLVAVKSDERFKGIPVIVLSTSDIEKDVQISYQLGAASYVTKPTGMEQFSAVIKQLGDYWTHLARLPCRHHYEH